MKIEGEISHPIHPQHRVKLEYTEIPFNCDGCKEVGIGFKYSCKQCEFDLHKICAVAAPTITHPFYRKCDFEFYYQPPGEIKRYCDACRNDVLGFVYHCKRCGFDMHPCCANLPQVLDDGEHNLYLCLKISSSCHRCGDKGPGWSYRSKCKSYNLHVSCVKELLVESWQAMYLNVDKNKVREMQTRIPSLRGTLENHHRGRRRRGGKVKKCCEMAGDAVRLIVSAILGDPTALIAAVIDAAASFKQKTIKFVNFTEEKDRDFFELDGEHATIRGEALQLTYDSTNDKDIQKHRNNSGRIMYRERFRIYNDGDILASFNSTFVINLYRRTEWKSGAGLAFLIAPNFTLPESSYGPWLGLTNAATDGSRENYIVAIEFATQKQDEFDPDDNHVGLNINSVKSNKSVSLNDSNITLSTTNSSVIKVWVQYDGTSKLMQVYMVEMQDEKSETNNPAKPLLNQTINLKDYLKAESYFGFSGSTGDPEIQLNCVLEWTLEIDVIPKKKDWKWLIITAGLGIPGVTILLIICIIVCMKKRRKARAEESHDHELGRLRWLPGMPREFKYKELKKATNNFHESMRLGEGGFGIVYKGILHDKDHHNSPTQVAVKKFSRDNIKSKADFLAELAIIHRLRHKHLVRLVGWCHEKGKVLLVYDYMPNGSVEKYLYKTSEQTVLNWNRRYRILAGVASALYYLQNEYDQKVVHRDLKASNILLDVDYNARLGDFGLARAIENERNSYTDAGLGGVPGTMGYVAPECFHTGKATPESDVFGFGAVVLEIVCGRSPGAMIPDQQNSYTLVDWVWMLHREGRIQDAVDKGLDNDIVEDEAERLLLLGLACSHPIASERPKTEDILQIISKTSPIPDVPPFRPYFTWPSTAPVSSIDSLLTSITISSQDSNPTADLSKSKNVSARLPV